MDHQNKTTKLNKQSVLVAKQIIQKIILQITAPPIDIGSRDVQSLIPNIYNENYNIYQGKCYQQFSPNLCGYHALFNTFCFLKLFNGDQSEYNIESAASFWKFKIKIENFLLQTKRRYKLPDQWPWREKDIRQGDFQRTYNKICLQRFEEFLVFKQHKNFYYLTHTWLFQYQNLVIQNDSKNELTQKFKIFQDYKESKPMVLHLMLGITTHWLTFIATKKDKKVNYWFIDSHNNQHLDFSWQQIVELIQRKSVERTKYGKPQFTKFQKQAYSMCIKDIQISLRLIINCIEGKQSLDQYIYNQKFNIFAQPLQAAMGADFQSASFVIKEYQHNINSFFVQKIQWHLLSHNNHTVMKSIIEYSGKIKNYNKYGKFLYTSANKQVSFWRKL